MTHRLALPGERYAFKRVKSDAAAAMREFSIDLEWFAIQCHMPCHYCGRIDVNKISVKSRSAKGGYIVKDFRYNGIDRKDNSIGYTKENCVPCCVVCNRGKNSMSEEDWEEYLNTVVEFRTRREDGYVGKHVRPVPLRALWRDSQAGNVPAPKFAQGGPIPKDRDTKWYFEDGCIIPKRNFFRATRINPVYLQKEESEQEE